MNVKEKNRKYKACVVPKCYNTTVSTPTKFFFNVPTEAGLRKRWRRAIGGFQRPDTKVSDDLYCCQDHFELQDDTTNYLEFHMDKTGNKTIELCLREDVLPHRFACQRATKRPAMVPFDCEDEDEYNFSNSSDANGFKEHSPALSEYFNYKINETRIRLSVMKKNNALISSCRPVKIVLNDLKHVISMKLENLTALELAKPNVDPVFTSMAVHGKAAIEKKRRKLISKMLTWERDQEKYIVISNQQRKSFEVFCLNSDLDITTYKTFTSINNVFFNYKALFHINKDRVNIGHYCCWFRRYYFIKELDPKYYRSIRFIDYKHDCEIHNCSCCCKSDFLKPREIMENSTISTITSKNRLMKILDSYETFAVTQNTPIINTTIRKALMLNEPAVKKLDILSFSNVACNQRVHIELNDEYYQIGLDGNLAVCSRKSANRDLSNSEFYYKANTCCWYKREQFIDSTYQIIRHKVKPSAIKFIRTPHTCPLNECTCCCRPKSSKRDILKPFMMVRHTTDVSFKKNTLTIGLPKPTPHPDQTNTTDMYTGNSTSLRNILTRMPKPYFPSGQSRITRDIIPTAAMPGDGISPLNSAVRPPNTTKSIIPGRLPSSIGAAFVVTPPRSILASQCSTSRQVHAPTAIQKAHTSPGQLINLVVDKWAASTSTSERRNLTLSCQPIFKSKHTPTNTSASNKVYFEMKVVPQPSTSNTKLVMGDIALPKSVNSNLTTFNLEPKRKSKCKAKSAAACRCKTKHILQPNVATEQCNTLAITNEPETKNIATNYNQSIDTEITVLKSKPEINTNEVRSVTATLEDCTVPADSEDESSTHSYIDHDPSAAVDAAGDSDTERVTGATINDIEPANKVELIKQILEKLKTVRFIKKPHNKLTAQLDTPLAELSTIDLFILNSTFVMVDHQYQKTGLSRRITDFEFDLSNISKNYTLEDMYRPEIQNVASVPADDERESIAEEKTKGKPNAE